MKQAVRVLLIEEDKNRVTHLQNLFQEIQDPICDVEWVPSKELALERLASPPQYDLCFLGYLAGQNTRQELLETILTLGHSLPIIFLVWQDDVNRENPSFAQGIKSYLVKGQIDAAGLERALRYALQQSLLEKELQAAQYREREIGIAIQETLLLHHPPANLNGIQFGAVFLPSEQVGGDYSDFIVYDESTLDVLIGDVMGKGIAAALIAAATKSHFQRAIRRLGLEMARFGRLPEPEEILAAVHTTLTPELLGLSSFVTLVYARFDLDHQQLTFIDCGHPRPFHYQRAKENCVILAGHNLPLGLSGEEQYRQTTIPFAPGDRFVFYTDGFTEAIGQNEEPFGEDRLEKLICTLQEQDAVAAAATLEASVLQHRVTPTDDLTCLVVDIGSLYRPLQLGYRNYDLSCDPDELAGVRRFIELFCLDYCQGNMSENAIFHLELAAHEAVSNIIRHAYPTEAPGRIQLEAIALENEVRIRIVDYGLPYPHHQEVPPPAFDGTRDHGFGLFLVAEGVDKQERFRDDMGRNILTLTKRYDHQVVGVRA